LYRLNVFPIVVPPLRKRREDIPILVEYFVKRLAEKMAKRIRRIDKHTLELCERYSWPSNIRELQNIVERSVILCSSNVFDRRGVAAQRPRQGDGDDRHNCLDRGAASKRCQIRRRSLSLWR
jgi:DNA-binding NtrC family response regulator